MYQVERRGRGIMRLKLSEKEIENGEIIYQVKGHSYYITQVILQLLSFLCHIQTGGTNSVCKMKEINIASTLHQPCKIHTY